MKFSRIIILLLAMTLIFAPTSSAWNGKTHSNIVDQVYHSMPASLQSKLNLNAMRDGSNDPDQVFHDTRDHSYPFSYTKAIYYLKLGKSYYNQENYIKASKDFGIASHYISDTFSAPHCVSREKSSLHQSYERKADKLTPHTTSVKGDLNTLLKNGKITGKSDWNHWIKSKNTYYVQKDLNKAASVTFFAITNILSVNSSPIITQTTNTNKYVGNLDTKKFHLITCSYVSQMSSSNKIYFNSRQEAINQGYIPCKVCNP